MNERIRELAEQAGSTHKQNLGVYQFYTDELEKFAELIVRDCACVPTDMWGEGQLPAEWAGRVQRRILTHFGVES